VVLSLFALYNGQRLLTDDGASNAGVSRQSLRHSDWLEHVLAVPEDLIDFFEVEIVGLWKE
jgi:hypothetical protein